MTRGVLLALLLLAGCDRASPVANADSAGARLEQAALSAGIVPDANAPLQGSWARDTDRLCVVGTGEGPARIGAAVDYGEGQSCAASGTVTRSGQELDVEFGQCRFAATFDGDRIVFPAELPAACDTLCSGRASLAALSVQRLSESRSEAESVRSPKGRLLCAN